MPLFIDHEFSICICEVILCPRLSSHLKEVFFFAQLLVMQLEEYGIELAYMELDNHLNHYFLFRECHVHMAFVRA